MDPALREKVRRFHLWVTFACGLLLVASSFFAAYLSFFRTDRVFPQFLVTLSRLVSYFR